MTTAVLERSSGSFADEALRVLVAHRWFIALTWIYALCGLIAQQVFNLPENMSLSLYSLVSIKLMLGFMAAWALIYPLYVMVFVRPERLTRHLIDDLRTNYLTTERLVGAFIIAVLMSSFFSVFTGFKTMISVINPHDWDVAFAAWDRWLHFGLHPWEILQPFIGFTWVTSVINILYNLWIVVLYLLLFWQAFSTRDHRLRMQFLLSFVLTWALLGSLLATLLASGGPVYYGRLTGLVDPFVPLMDYLRAADEIGVVWALKVQETMWVSHMSGAYDYGAGISAMPSIHVSAAMLFALLGWRVHRWLGIGLTAFLIVIIIGSVHTGWHYAIDGYVSVVLTYVIWRLCGLWVSREESLSPG